MEMDLSNPKFLAAIDMGSNSFKLLIVRAESNGKFLVIDHFKEPVVLGRGMISNSSSISPESIIKATLALKKFNQILQKSHIICRTQIVATSAVREAVNRGEFLLNIKEKSGFGDDEIRVLSGVEEARFVYMGILQFLPVYDKTVLAIDIGGGSTEFVIGKSGKVLFSISLKLGHVSLTDEFVKGGKMIVNIRNYIRSVIYESGLVEKVKEIGFDIAVGSSGTIKSIEKAVSLRYGCDLSGSVVANGGEFSRDWKFNKEELVGVVEKLCEGGDDDEEIRRNGFFKRRSEFILAGAVLLLEIFEILGINEMEVSEYALGEGVIAETLASCCEDYDIKANARWLSVTKLATRFNTDKRMKLASLSVGIAKEMFKGLRKSDKLANHQFLDTVSLDEKDLEYLEAACLLHNIGLFIGKKGYHKHSHHIIKNGEHLHGYSTEEVELISLLARHHRKKFPKSTQGSLGRFPKEVKEKFKILCAILRISIAVQHCKLMTFHGLDTSNCQEGFKLVFNEKNGQSLPPGGVKLSAEDVVAELKSELNHFQEVVKMKLLIAVSPSS
ncbi:hypothetical protein MKW98_004648 [Papaver atlanticum]|uniref:Exopolyphosphatase n=1 Tax=Papaver atlanticum TaxID=357466 RepID=A0AAD4SNI1_9MAGN|nr:hypothetical protein MKW98_004648 [Papaver atlanticum]